MKEKKITTGKRYVYFNVSGITAPSEKANGMMVTLLDSSSKLVLFDENVNGHRADSSYNIPEGRAWYVDAKDLFELNEWERISEALRIIPADKINQIFTFLNK